MKPDDCARLAGWIEEAGYPDQAARLLRGYIADHSHSPVLGRFYLELGLLRMRQGQLTSAYQHLLDALESDPDTITEKAAREALQRIERSNR